jgi:pre-mRNA-splicing factor ISY1
MKDIDSKYYGFLDDDDCRLVPVEVEVERHAVEAAVTEWKAKRERGEADVREGDEEEEDIYALPPAMSEEDRVEEAMLEGKEARFTAHVAVPTQKDIEEALLRRKKQELMRLFALDDDNEDETKK